MATGFEEDIEKEYILMEQDIKRGLGQVAQQVNADATPFIPFASGSLRESFQSGISINKIDVTLSFGYTAEYAVEVHETLMNHASKQPITKSFQDFFRSGSSPGPEGVNYWAGWNIARQENAFERYDAKYLEKSLNKHGNEYTDIIARLLQ
jgi:hypothetical protein